MEIYLSSKRQEKITPKEYPFMDNFVIKFIGYFFLTKRTNVGWAFLQVRIIDFGFD
jgi:hypothetical protein